MSAELKARVDAQNKANRIANELGKKLQAFFADYVGKQICKADNGLLQRLKDKLEVAIPELKQHVPGVQIYRDASYGLRWTVKVSENVPGAHFCVYREASIWVGDQDNNHFLVRVSDPQDRPTNYDADTVLAARAAYKEAQAVADELKGKLHPFGEYDR